MPTSPTCRTTRKSGAQYERKASDIISLQQQIAGDIADRLRSKLSGTESQQVTEQGTQNPEAYQLYVRGRYYWNMRTSADIKTAISYFNQAIDKDPGYALAYSGIADADGVLINYGSDRNDVTPKASAAAEKALELDPARPHAVLGYNKMLYDWNSRRRGRVQKGLRPRSQRRHRPPVVLRDSLLHRWPGAGVD